jgi:antitoxin ParD1/3/4
LTQNDAVDILVFMRATMNISLPPSLKQGVDRQVNAGGFATASEYVRQLLREQQRREARLAVEAKLHEGEASGEPQPVTDATWRESEERVAKRLKTESRKRRPNASNR